MRVNMVFNLETAAIIICIIWLIALTVLYFQLSSHYDRLTHGISTKTLKSILEDLLTNVSHTQKGIAELNIRYDTIEKDSHFHIQKIGLLRFNPFKDTGGDQSFILTLLDATETGVVISGLYSRSGMRWYAKRVINGKGVDHDLSEEEKKAIKVAEKANA